MSCAPLATVCLVARFEPLHIALRSGIKIAKTLPKYLPNPRPYDLMTSSWPLQLAAGEIAHVVASSHRIVGSRRIKDQVRLWIFAQRRLCMLKSTKSQNPHDFGEVWAITLGTSRCHFAIDVRLRCRVVYACMHGFGGFARRLRMRKRRLGLFGGRDPSEGSGGMGGLRQNVSTVGDCLKPFEKIIFHNQAVYSFSVSQLQSQRRRQAS